MRTKRSSIERTAPIAPGNGLAAGEMLTVLAALALLGGQAAPPALAQDNTPAASTSANPPLNPVFTSASPTATGVTVASSDNSGKQKGKKGKQRTEDPNTQKVPEKPKGTAEKLFGPLFRDITLTGNFSTRYQQNSVNGTADGSQRFTDQNLSNPDYRNVGPFQNNVDMTVQGKIFNAFNVNARLSNSRYGNYYNQVFAFDYHNRDNTTKLDLGNVNATLPGNQFVMFSRSVQGIRIERTGKLSPDRSKSSAIRPLVFAPPAFFTPLVSPWWEWPVEEPATPVSHPVVAQQKPTENTDPAKKNTAGLPNNTGMSANGGNRLSQMQTMPGTNPYSAQMAGRNNTAASRGFPSFPSGNDSSAVGNPSVNGTASTTGLGFDTPDHNAFVSSGHAWSIKSQGVASLTRALTRRGSFRGTGTSGPYFLNAGSLVEGSERVQLNGQDLKEGEDYKIDYLLGQISFLNGRIITAEDTVTFTYEAQNYNTTPGLLTGSRFDIGDPNGNHYGLTYVQQKAIGLHSRNGNLTERFPVMADATYRYTLSSVIDPASPVVISWYNRVLVEGVDYILNRDLRYFQLITSALPPDNAATYNGIPSLSVTYHPIQQNSVAGDRSVLGLDSTLRVAKNATMSFDVGRSEGASAQQDGQAIAVRTTWNGSGRGNKNAWQFTTGVKQVGETFSTIDSTAGAFLQPERSFNTGIRFSPNQAFIFSTNLTQGTVGNRSYTPTTTTNNSNSLVWANNRTWDFHASMNVRRMPTLNFSHQQTDQSGSGTTNTLSTTSLDAGWQASSQLGFTAGLSRTGTRGRSVFASAYNNSVASSGNTGSTIIDQLQDSSGSQTITNSVADNARFAATFTPKSWLSFAGNLGFSRSHAATGGSTSRSTGISATASPTQQLSLNASLTDTNNGQSTAGFYNPGASGSSTIIPTNSSGQRTRTGAFGFQYSPSSHLTGQFNINHTLSLVPGYDNTQSGGIDWTLTAAPREKWQFSLTGSDQDVTYVGGQGNSRNKALTFNMGAGPFGRVKVDGTLARMNFGSASYFGSSGTGTTPGTRLIPTYPLPAYPLTRATTSPTYLGGGSGYFQAGDNTSWSLSADYMLGPRYSLIGRWQALDQSAPASSTNSSGSSTSGTAAAGTNFWQGQGSIGLDFRLTEILGFTVNFNYINLRDRDNSRYSYRARMMTADFSAHF